jgi:hypothetical protein
MILAAAACANDSGEGQTIGRRLVRLRMINASTLKQKERAVSEEEYVSRLG